MHRQGYFLWFKEDWVTYSYWKGRLSRTKEVASENAECCQAETSDDAKKKDK